MNPLVSIITPMKNASGWVTETIESIRQQSMEEWELIVIDDHSEDNSFAIVSLLREKDSRIRVFRNEGKGIISALNQAFVLAKGTYVTRMDADDLMPENRLQWMVDALEELPEKAIVTGKVRYFSEAPVSEGYLKYENWLNNRIEHNDFYDHIFRECIVASPNWMGRTSEFHDYRLFEALNYPEDYDLCFHWMKNGFRIYPVGETTLLWREHPLRTSRNSDHYQQRSFFRLKLNWLMHLYPFPVSVGIVGMGAKGKICAEHFFEKEYPFRLYDLKFKNFNSPLFGKTVMPPESVDDEIVLIARYPEVLDEIQVFIEQKGYEIGKNAFWV